MGNGLVTLARATMVADEFGTEHYGTIAGALAVPATIARALGPVAYAALATLAGGYPPVFLLSAAAFLLAALVVSASQPFAATSSWTRRLTSSRISLTRAGG